MSYGLARFEKVLQASKTAQALASGAHRLLTWNSPTLLKNFTESSDVFTCTIPGVYAFMWQYALQTAATKRTFPAVYKNGSYILRNVNEAQGLASFPPVFFFVSLAIGDTVGFYSQPSGATGSYNTETTPSSVSILQGFWLGGPGASPPARARAKLVAAVTATAMGTGDSTVVFDSPSVNTAGFTEFSDVFTCTIPGIYAATCSIESSNAGTYSHALRLIKNSSTMLQSSRNYRNSYLCGFVELSIGDSVKIETNQVTANTLVANSFLELILL